MRNTLRLFGLTVILICTSCASTQRDERGVRGVLHSDTLLGEVESKPDDLRGVWIVDGRRFVADDSTSFDLDHSFEVGRLVEVEYDERDGVLYAEEIKPQSFSVVDVSDGPYVFWPGSNAVDVINFCRGRKQQRSIDKVRREQNDDGLVVIRPSCDDLLEVVIDTQPLTPPRAEWNATKKLIAISDVEGEYDNFVRFLRIHNVIDEKNNWKWGRNRLVFIGDMVDRGDQVTETLWMIRRLELEAKRAGGSVHYVIGNHEAMGLAADLRYVHPKYDFVGRRLGMRYDELYGPTSEIGRWLRTRNAVERIGDVLFVHGGISPELVDAGFDIERINEQVRCELGRRKPTSNEPMENHLTWNSYGPMWYRGYFEKYADRVGGVPSPDEIGRICAAFGVNHIVVGHSVVDKPQMLDADGHLIAIDVHWTKQTAGAGLLIENGEIYGINANGGREKMLRPAAVVMN